MSERIRAHIRRQFVGYLALFVALSGTAWAVDQVTSGDIARNAVRSKHIKKNQVKAPDVAAGAITGSEVIEATLEQVPSATSAQTAASAQTAQSAQTADSAQTAQSAQSAQSAESAQSANTADTLDGLDSTAFLGKTEKAVDSDKVDGADQCSSRVIRLTAVVSDAIICEAGGARLIGVCDLQAGNTVAQIWIPNSSTPVYGASTAGTFNGGGGVFTLLTSTSDAPGGGSTRSNATAFYLADESGDQIAGIMGVRATSISAAAGNCDIILSAMS